MDRKKKRWNNRSRTITLTCLNGDLELENFHLNRFGVTEFGERKVFTIMEPVTFTVQENNHSTGYLPFKRPE